MHLLSPQRGAGSLAADEVDDVVGAAFLPTDGQATPPTSRRRWPRARGMTGVTIREDVAVTGIEVENGRGARRDEPRGARRVRKLVICARPMVARSGALAGVNVPLVSGAASVYRHRAHRRASRRACRRCAIPTASPTGRRRSAAW